MPDRTFSMKTLVYGPAIITASPRFRQGLIYDIYQVVSNAELYFRVVSIVSAQDGVFSKFAPDYVSAAANATNDYFSELQPKLKKSLITTRKNMLSSMLSRIISNLRLRKWLILERETRFELATPTLARLRHPRKTWSGGV